MISPLTPGLVTTQLGATARNRHMTRRLRARPRQCLAVAGSDWQTSIKEPVPGADARRLSRTLAGRCNGAASQAPYLIGGAWGPVFLRAPATDRMADAGKAREATVLPFA